MSLRPVALIGSALALQSCAFFSGKPPLPKHASIEHVAKPAATTDFAALVESADVIYFPSDRVESAGRSEPAALLVEAFTQPIALRTIGWGAIDFTQQHYLDHLSGETSRAERESQIRELELAGSGRAREHCRSVLRDVRGPAIHHLALGCPQSLLAKVAGSERLSAEEEKLLPRGYVLPVDGFEAYLGRSSAPRLAEPSLAQSYRTALVRQQFAAERIVHHAPKDAGGKLLVFVGADDLDEHGVPYYVQTYNDIWKLTDPLLKLARKNPTAYQLVGHLIRASAYPLPWILGDFAKVGYYEKENLPNTMDADFLVVQEDRIAEVEAKLQNAYYTTPFTIRQYQDTSKLYLSAKVFKDFFPGKVPDFAGRAR